LGSLIFTIGKTFQSKLEMTQIKLTKSHLLNQSTVTIFYVDQLVKLSSLDKQQTAFLKKEVEAHKKEVVPMHELNDLHFFVPVKRESATPDSLEKLRGVGSCILGELNKMKCSDVLVVNETSDTEFTIAITEGIALSNYQFLKYFKNKSERKNSLAKIHLLDKKLTQEDADELSNLLESTMLARTLINEPLSYLTAMKFSEEMQKAAKNIEKLTVKVLKKADIEKLKMGGLLAVNRGSMDPPTFNILEYKPLEAKNKKPIVLVGKGVVFDTGGLSLKPTPGSMDEMKCDMSGGAAVVGAIQAIAANNLPVYVIGLIPATDNRPGMNAVVPQDIITMMDGTTVEVLNTDAEGRLILADALVYAQRFEPDLVIDLATLTGAAVRAVGTYASAIMGTADQKTMDGLAESGMQVWERTMQFPLWKDYGEEIKSDVADLKNLGAGNAGHISAGKFLEHFTEYPWIHIDIAGPAFISADSSYRTKGGTGVGVRLLYDFIKRRYL